jgi:uncharacterized protein YqeY
MKHKETLRVSIIRMMLAEIVRKEKEKGISIDDETTVKVLYGMIKKGEEAAAQFEAAGRKDAAEKERAEVEIIKSYLPRQLSVDEIRGEALKVIAETGVRDLKGVGKVMGVLSKRLLGKAAGNEMSKVVREELEKLQSIEQEK